MFRVAFVSVIDADDMEYRWQTSTINGVAQLTLWLVNSVVRVVPVDCGANCSVSTMVDDLRLQSTFSSR
jgi:hypothetical protein